jgi:hypothetical protein
VSIDSRIDSSRTTILLIDAVQLGCMVMETTILTLPVWGWILDLSLLVLIHSFLQSNDAEYDPIQAFLVGFAVFGLVKVVVHLA